MINKIENGITAPAIIIPSSFRATEENNTPDANLNNGSELIGADAPSFSQLPQPKLYRVEKIESLMPIYGAARGRIGFDKPFVVFELWRSRTTVGKNGVTLGAEIAENINTFLKISDGDIIADLGSGPGIIARSLADKTGQTGWLYAIDASEGMLANTTKSLDGNHRRTIIHGDIHVVDKLIKEPVDGAVLSGNVHLLSNPEMAFRAIHKILKPFGKLAVVCHAYFHGNSDTSNFYARSLDNLVERRPDVYANGLRLPMLSGRELDRIISGLSRSGFHVQARENVTWAPDVRDVFGIPPEITVRSRLKIAMPQLTPSQIDSLAQGVLSDVSAGRQAQVYLCCTKKEPAFRLSIPWETSGKNMAVLPFLR